MNSQMKVGIDDLIKQSKMIALEYKKQLITENRDIGALKAKYSEEIDALHSYAKMVLSNIDSITSNVEEILPPWIVFPLYSFNMFVEGNNVKELYSTYWKDYMLINRDKIPSSYRDKYPVPDALIDKYSKY